MQQLIIRAFPLSIEAWDGLRGIPGWLSQNLNARLWGQCMCKTTGKVKILLVGGSPLLEAEAKDVEHPAIVFVTADPARVAASQEAATDCDVVVVNLDHLGGLDLVADLCARPGASPVIGLGALGVPGRSLEHLLLLAELRGAALAIPGPIDAIELALNALEVLRVPGFDKVASDLERRIAW